MAINTRREVTRIIAHEIHGRWAYGDPDYTIDDARRANEDGWTFDTAGPRGGDTWVRTEGARLSPDALRTAFADATRLAESGRIE